MTEPLPDGVGPSRVRPHRALFLDRDGTVIIDHGYLREPERVAYVAGAAAALRALATEGYLLVLISNQSGVARGLITEAEAHAVHAATVALLAKDSLVLLASRYCYHAPDAGCPCRKPAPLMLQQVAAAHDIDLGGSVMIGDRDTDIQAGKAAGCRAIALGYRSLLADCSAPTWSDVLAYLAGTGPAPVDGRKRS